MHAGGGWDLNLGPLASCVLFYYLTYTLLVMGREIFFLINPWTNRYLRLIHRYRLMVPPDTNVKITIRYLW